MPQDMEKKPFERGERGERRERGPRRERREQSEFQEKMVAINRVSKTVKGGRNMRFSALVVIGDGKGRVGCGIGKAVEIPEAARKATEDAKKHLVHVSLKGTSIPHETVGRFGTGEVVLMPAPEGTGVIAGGPARAVLELCGVKDIRTKSYGSNNPINMVKALEQIRTRVAAIPIDIAETMLVETASTGQVPRTRTRTGFSAIMPLSKVQSLLFLFINWYLLQ